jgi:hypothetical protein
MAEIVVNGATLACSKAVPPGTTRLVVLPTPRVQSGNQPVATVADIKPMANVPSFGMCTAELNPTVIAATAAASGVKTPGACAPVIPAPWTPGSPKVVIGNIAALTSDSSCMCAYLGKITVKAAGQKSVTTG